MPVDRRRARGFGHAATVTMTVDLSSTPARQSQARLTGREPEESLAGETLTSPFRGSTHWQRRYGARCAYESTMPYMHT